MDAVNSPDCWWSRVTGPRTVVESIAEYLAERTNVLFRTPTSLPWYDSFAIALRSDIERKADLVGLGIERIDLSHAAPEVNDPGTYLLNRYGRIDERDGYRSGRGITIQNYLQSKGILKRKILWVRLNASALGPWVDFCRKWQIRKHDECLFLLESDGMPPRRSRWLRLVDYADIVTEFDVRLFNSLLFGSGELARLSTTWKRYGIAIATHLCDGDPLAASRLLKDRDFLKEDTLQISKSILGDGNENELRKRLWVGQLEVLFPLIEEERLEIVDRLRSRLDELVGAGITQFDGPVQQPEDVEFGTLVYLMASGRLAVDDKETRQRIHLLRDCRNLLAHRTPLNAEQVQQLLGY